MTESEWKINAIVEVTYKVSVRADNEEDYQDCLKHLGNMQEVGTIASYGMGQWRKYEVSEVRQVSKITKN